MIGASAFFDRVKFWRPPGALKRETKVLLLTALRFRDHLGDYFNGIESDTLLLGEDAIDDLTIALTELAEDLHSDAGIWRSLEAYNREFFGVPLPLLCKPSDSALKPFDVRRFQFFLYSVWRHFVRIASFPLSIAVSSPSRGSPASISPGHSRTAPPIRRCDLPG